MDLVDKEEKIRIWSVYNSGDIEKIIEELEKEEINEERITIVGGDFNIRIGEEGRYINAEEEEEWKRRSKDKVIGNNCNVFAK